MQKPCWYTFSSFHDECSFLGKINRENAFFSGSWKPLIPPPDVKGAEGSLQGQDSPSLLRWHSRNTAYINYHFPSAVVLQRVTHLFYANVMEPLKGLLFFPLCLHCSPTKCNLPLFMFHAPAINTVALKMVISNFQSSHFVFINPPCPDCVLSPLSFPEPYWPCLFLPAYNLKASSSSSIQLWKWQSQSSMETHCYWCTI